MSRIARTVLLLESQRPARKFSTRKIILLVYGIIAIIIVSEVSAATFQYVQWFDGMNGLQVSVNGFRFIYGNGSASDPFRALINATVSNPTSFAGIRLKTIYYSVFLNSTTEQWVFRDSPQFSLRSYTYGKTIAQRTVLNITYAPQVDTEVASSARAFLDAHPNDLIPVVGITLVLASSFGTITVPYCFQMPTSQRTICPPTRSPLPSRFR